MDDAEAHVARYLEYLGVGPIVYEPDGNHPPDFVTRERIAIEVRRLNQHVDLEGRPVALEYDSFPLLKGMRRLLASFGSAREGRAWWVHYDFRRPVPPWRTLEPLVRDVLREVDRTGIASDRSPHPRFDLRFIDCRPPLDDRFQLAGYADYNAGGWLLNELQRNAQICVNEKTARIAPYRDKYERWWLVLIDRIGYASSSLEVELIHTRLAVRHTFEQLVLLSPLDHTRAVLVPPTGGSP